MAVAIGSAIIHSDDADKAEATRIAAMTPEQRAADAKQKHDAAEIYKARYECQEFVRRSLHDPDAAQFDSALGYPARKNNDGTYLVEVNVRAKNGFGALRHISVLCNTRPVDSGWVAVSIREL
jgi:hypothetical protein